MEKTLHTMRTAAVAAGTLFAAQAMADTYNDLGPRAGECNDYWNTAARPAVAVSACASGSAVPIDGWSRTQAESGPIPITSFPSRGLCVVFR